MKAISPDITMIKCPEVNLDPTFFFGMGVTPRVSWIGFVYDGCVTGRLRFYGQALLVQHFCVALRK
jgi:hypothetical protein